MNQDLKGRLEEIARTPRPGPAPDVAAAAARGRRVLRTRRVTTALASATAIGLAATVTANVLTGEPGDPPPVTAAGPGTLTQPGTFGWLPKGYEVTRLQTDGRMSSAEANAAGRSGGQGDPAAISLNVLQAGAKVITGREPSAGQIKGRPAWWKVRPGPQVPTEAQLIWQRGKDVWASLIVTDPKVATDGVMRRIAESAVFSAQPIALPVKVKGVPRADFVAVALTQKPRLSVTLGITLHQSRSEQDLTITVAPARPPLSHGKPLKPNARVDGHSAYTGVRRPGQGQPDYSYLWVFGTDGFDVKIEAADDTVQRLQASGGLAGLYRRITLLGTDPARWSRTPPLE
ncbi:hypothetical protein ACGFNU_37865 [Spirillospora sp. NPDC048911]|uniref:hypothetical protein n=1 Tax=Spirillospora sp. NPDC048911 TaxID=3364527 RepID=UPI00371EEBA3